MLIRAPLRFVPLVLLAALVGCGGTSAEPEELNGLRPGSYSVVFEIFPTINTPDEALGRHRIVFRVNSPGTSAENFEVVSAVRTPPSGPAENDYVAISADETDVSENRWIVRFEAQNSDYQVSFSIGNAGFGDFQVLSGCFIRLPSGTTFQGSGCVVDRA